MAEFWQIRVFDQHEPVYSTEVPGKVVLGRQGTPGERLYSKTTGPDGTCRIVMAGRDEDFVSRQHAQLDPSGPGTLRLKNVSAKVPIRLQDNTELMPGADCELVLPTVITLGRKVIRVLEVAPDDLQFQSLPEATSPGVSMATPTVLTSLNIPGQNINFEEIITWLKAAMGVLQSAATSHDFFEKAAQAVVETVGLDTGRVLLLEGGEWRTVSAFSDRGEAPGPSRRPAGAS